MDLAYNGSMTTVNGKQVMRILLYSIPTPMWGWRVKTG